MSFYETLDQDFKSAMKAREEVRLSTLRMLKTSIKNKEVELRRKLDDDELLGLVKNQVKQRRDSIDQFKKGGRDDLTAREEAELAVLEAYLPTRISPGELEKLLADLIVELDAKSPKDMGKVMKAFMARHGGHADGKLAGDLAKRILAGG
ncbi:MAG: GatB/YqeY domain-containing protein [Pseudomonadota bacterium]